MQQKEMSLDSSSSLILTIIIMSMSCEFMAAHPQHSSFYPLTAKSSSSCSSLSSPTLPGVQKFTHFSLPSKLSVTWPFLNGGTPQQPQTHLALLRKVCSFEAQKTVSPLSPPMLFPMLPFQAGRDFWEQSMQTLTHPSFKSFQTPSCRESYKTLAVDQDRQVTSQLCPSSSCWLPGSRCALRPPCTAN